MTENSLPKISALCSVLGQAIAALDNGTKQLGEKAGKAADFVKVHFAGGSVTPDSARFYWVRSEQTATKMTEFLKLQGVPAMVVAAENKGPAGNMIIVPTEYEREADRMIGGLNKFIVKTELNRADFMNLYRDSKVVEFGGVTPEQLRLMRDELCDKPVAYCVIPQHNGTYKVVTDLSDRSVVAQTVYETRLNLNGPIGKDLKEFCHRQEEVEKRVFDAMVSNGSDRKTDVVIADVSKPGNAVRIKDNALYLYREGQRPVLVPLKNPTEAFAKAIADIHQYDKPIAGEIESKAKVDVSPRVEGIATKEEIAACSQAQSKADIQNGHVETAQSIADKLVSLTVATHGLDDAGRMIETSSAERLNTELHNAEAASWAEQAERSRYGVDELLHKVCDVTSLDVTVIEEVLQYAKNDINYLLEARANGTLTEDEKYTDITYMTAKEIDEQLSNIVTVDDEPEQSAHTRSGQRSEDGARDDKTPAIEFDPETFTFEDPTEVKDPTDLVDHGFIPGGGDSGR